MTPLVPNAMEWKLSIRKIRRTNDRNLIDENIEGKEELLVTSNFSFSLNVFPLKTFLYYNRILNNCCLQTLSAWASAISPFPTVFSTYLDELSAIFIKFRIVVCKLFYFERV